VKRKTSTWESPWLWFAIFATALTLGVGIYFTFFAKMDLAFLVPESETVAEEPVIEEMIEPLEAGGEETKQPQEPPIEEKVIPEPEPEPEPEDPNAHLSLSYFRRNPVTKNSIEEPKDTGLEIIVIGPSGFVESIVDRVLTIKGYSGNGKLSVYIPEDTLIARFSDEGKTIELGPEISEYYAIIYGGETVVWHNAEKIALEDLQRGDRIQIWMWVKDDGSIGIAKVHKLKQQ